MRFLVKLSVTVTVKCIQTRLRQTASLAGWRQKPWQPRDISEHSPTSLFLLCFGQGVEGGSRHGHAV